MRVKQSKITLDVVVNDTITDPSGVSLTLRSSCWLSFDYDTGRGTLWAFVGPVIAVVLVRL